MRRFFIILTSFILSFSSPPLLEATPQKTELLTGWYSWDPYQFEDMSSGVPFLTGLDIALVRAILKELGYEAVYKPVSWKQHQEDLKNGTRNFAAGATKTKAREAFVYFSKPYRFEENALFVLRGSQGVFETSSIDAFLTGLTEKQQKIAVIDGFIYADSKINDWIADPKNKDLVLLVPTDQKSFDALLSGKAQGVLADRLVGSTIIWRKNLGGEVDSLDLNIKTPIHLMFSKKITTPEFMVKVNKAIDTLQETQKYQEIIRLYLYPVLLLQTVSAWWFQVVEIIGIFSFAVSGLLIAYRQNSTIFGAFLFALLPSLGGGIVRDIIFQREPIGMLTSPLYLGIVVVTVLGGMLAIRIMQHYKKVMKSPVFSPSGGATFLMVTDALGLASFTVTGVIVSVISKAEPLWLWGGFFAFLTAAGGGIMRDMLSGGKHIVVLHGGLYAEIAVGWGVLLSAFLIYQSNSVNADPIEYAVAITIAGAFLTRLLCYFFKVPNIRLKKQ
tara:strand:- start:2130 stop:3629 length:1500 start_codon:yes stop_codon:yes gene_type:complete